MPPKAKRVVVLWQGGGPSHVDLFDEKPILQANGGARTFPTPCVGIRGSAPCRQVTENGHAFRRSSRTPATVSCGMRLSTMLPDIGALADDICLVRSLHTEAVNHAPGVTFFMTGSQVPGRPSMGAWLSYGLGSETDNLPTFVVMTSSDKDKTCGQLFYDYYWGSGFLPSRFQGVRFRNTGDPVPYLANPPGVSPAAREIAAGRHRRNEQGPPGRLRRPRDRYANLAISKWHFGCSRASRTWSISRTSPHPFSSATVPMSKPKEHLPTIASSRAACLNEVLALYS